MFNFDKNSVDDFYEPLHYDSTRSSDAPDSSTVLKIDYYLIKNSLQINN